MTTTTTTTASDGHSRRSQDAGARTPSVGPSRRGLDAGACLGRGPFVAARHACACPPSGPLAASIWSLRSASASALGCNASDFAVVAPSATPASSRPGQWLPRRGKVRRLQLVVLPRLRPRSRHRQREHHREYDNNDTTRMAATTPTMATKITAITTTPPQPQQELHDNDGHDNAARPQPQLPQQQPQRDHNT
jgi:hypothetical protein